MLSGKMKGNLSSFFTRVQNRIEHVASITKTMNFVMRFRVLAVECFTKGTNVHINIIIGTRDTYFDDSDPSNDNPPTNKV